jgi:hypothetical protein
MTAEMVEKKIQVTVVIDFGPLDRPQIQKTVSVTASSTVLNAVRIAVPVVTSRKFGMDYFVDSICGVANDFASSRAWNFVVNGYRSNVPAERYLVKRGDWIEWLYSEDV